MATWNLLWRFGDWEPRQALIDDVLVETQPSVLLLQETWPDQAERIATLLGLDVIAFEGGHFDQKLSKVPNDEFFGNAILARSDHGATLVHQASFAAPGDPAPRNLLVARIGEVLIATSHLTHISDSHDGRVAQIQHVASVLDELGGPSIFCGDHNLVPSSPEHGVAEELGFVDEWLDAHPNPETVDDLGATMVPANPEISMTRWMDDRNKGNAPKGSGVRLDYVWTRAGERPRPTIEKLVRFGFGDEHRWPSDHLGLTCQLTI